MLCCIELKKCPVSFFLPCARIRYPVEKERPLDAAVFLRFAACGAVCGSTAHATLIPIDVVKTRMQSEPKKYPDMVSTFDTLVKEEVRACACLLALLFLQPIASFRRDLFREMRKWAGG